MEVEIRQIGAVTQLTFEGRLDAAASGLFGDHLASALSDGGRHLRIDLSDVHYMSSAGIRVLLSFFKLLQDLGGSLLVTSASTTVENVLELAGFGALMQFSTAALDDPKAEADDVIETSSARMEVYQLPRETGYELLTVGKRNPSDQTPQVVRFPNGVLGAGRGRSMNITSEPMVGGLFLAAGGTAIVQAMHGMKHPDYVASSGILIPEVEIEEGWVLNGGPSVCLRFEGINQDPALRSASLESLVATAADKIQSPNMAFCLIAEPAISDETPWTETGMMVATGLAFSQNPEGAKPGIKPNLQCGEFAIEVIGAMFPSAWIPTGRIALAETLESLLNVGNPLALYRPDLSSFPLHFLRGALWAGDVKTVGMDIE